MSVVDFWKGQDNRPGPTIAATKFEEDCLLAIWLKEVCHVPGQL